SEARRVLWKEIRGMLGMKGGWVFSWVEADRNGATTLLQTRNAIHRCWADARLRLSNRGPFGLLDQKVLPDPFRLTSPASKTHLPLIPSIPTISFLRTTLQWQTVAVREGGDSPFAKCEVSKLRCSGCA